MKRILAYATLVAVLALAFPASALAAGPEDGRIVLGGTFTLGSGESLNGDLVVVGGNVTLEAGSTVNGNVFMLGGNGSAAGEIRGDVSMIGGNLSLLATAVVRGNVNTFGGNIDRTPGRRSKARSSAGKASRVRRSICLPSAACMGHPSTASTCSTRWPTSCGGSCARC